MNSDNQDGKNLKAHYFNNQKNIDGMHNLNMMKKNLKKYKKLKFNNRKGINKGKIERKESSNNNNNQNNNNQNNKFSNNNNQI